MHKHIIGMLQLADYAELATEEDVAKDIINDMEYNDTMNKYGYTPLKKIFNAKQYTDFRCSTNLERFKYCPECGEKIDWKKVRIEIEEELEGQLNNADY